MINLTIAITSENCTDGKYNKSSLLRKLEEEVTIINKILPMLSVLFNIYLFIKYRNFRPFTRTGRLLHTAKKRVNRLPALVDNPHVVIQLFGGENVTLR